MTAPTQVSDDDAKQAYLKRCMEMTHGQLYAELMRVHKEATAMILELQNRIAELEKPNELNS